MLQQRLARSLQAIARQSPSPSLLRSPRTSFASRRVIVAPTSSLRLPTQRWYSSAQEAEQKPEETSEESTAAKGSQEASKPETTTEDPVQKELESKKKDVIELTVNSHLIAKIRCTLTSPSGSVETISLRVPQFTRADEARSEGGTRFCTARIRPRSPRKHRQLRSSAINCAGGQIDQRESRPPQSA